MHRAWLALAVFAFTGSTIAAPVPKGSNGTLPKRKTPFRILLMAGAAGREYQMLKQLLLREIEARRADVTLLLQPVSGRKEKPRELLRDEKPFSGLTRFPDEMSAARPAKPRSSPFDLAGYDLIVAIDPDWTRLTEKQAKNLHKWVTELGGGLIVLAGPINFPLLNNKETKLDPIRNLLPVSPVNPDKDKADSSRPWMLEFGGEEGRPAYLKLDPKSKDRFSGWEQFFRDGKPKKKADPPDRGFFSCHPVTSVKEEATVWARSTEPAAKMADGKGRPFLVTKNAKRGKVVYIGSAEIYRLGLFKRDYYDRFWTGLLANAGSAR
jgi:hypothetical protein